MNKVKLAFAFTLGVLFFACGDKTEIDFSIVPVKGSNGEYQYIDLSQKGKIVINPQFSEANIFKGDLARVKTSGKDGKWGYIDKNGKFAINPVYSFTQDFSDDVAWVQIEDQPPMLIDKKGKMILQIDSLVNVNPFNNGIAKIAVYNKGQALPMFIDKKGEIAMTTIDGQNTSLYISEDLYAVQNKETGKWGYKNKKGETVINEQFDVASTFLDGIAEVKVGDKWGAINKNGDFIINPQFDELRYDSDGLFIAIVGKKYGWVNKKGEIIINPQFDDVSGGFYGSKLAPVKIGSKYGYIDRNGQIAINPQFDESLPFGEDYAMVVNKDKDIKIGFIDKKGNFVIPPLYDGNPSDINKYKIATRQNVFNFSLSMYGQFLPYESLNKKIEAWAEEQRKKEEDEKLELAQKLEELGDLGVALISAMKNYIDTDNKPTGLITEFFEFNKDTQKRNAETGYTYTTISAKLIKKVNGCENSVWEVIPWSEDERHGVDVELPKTQKCQNLAPRFKREFYVVEKGGNKKISRTDNSEYISAEEVALLVSAAEKAAKEAAEKEAAAEEAAKKAAVEAAAKEASRAAAKAAATDAIKGLKK